MSAASSEETGKPLEDVVTVGACLWEGLAAVFLVPSGCLFIKASGIAGTTCCREAGAMAVGTDAGAGVTCCLFV